MENLEWINQSLSSYRHSEYNWKRELIIELEKYFDNEFREYLNYAGFKEIEMREILLHLLILLTKVIELSDFYFEGDKFRESSNYKSYNAERPRNKKDVHLNLIEIKKLFTLFTLHIRIFEKNISAQLIKYYECKGDIKNTRLVKNQMIIQNEKLLSETKILFKEFYNK